MLMEDAGELNGVLHGWWNTKVLLVFMLKPNLLEVPAKADVNYWRVSFEVATKAQSSVKSRYRNLP